MRNPDLSILSKIPPEAAAQGIPGTNPTAALITVLTQLVVGQSAMTAALTDAISSLPGWVPVPAAVGSPGVAGQIAYEAGFFYVCVAANTWRRVAIAVF